MPTSTPEPVVHQPTLPGQADLERVDELFGCATEELQGINFRLRAYMRPYLEDDEVPAARPTLEDLGRLTVLINNLELDRWSLGEEIANLRSHLNEAIMLEREGTASDA